MPLEQVSNLGSYNIKIINVTSPWDDAEMDYTTNGTKTIKINPKIDVFEIGIRAVNPEIIETASNALFELSLSSPADKNIVVKLKNQDNVTKEYAIPKGMLKNTISVSNTPLDDFTKNFDKVISLSIVEALSQDGQKFESISYMPDYAEVKITDNIDDTLFDLDFVDDNGNILTKLAINENPKLRLSTKNRSTFIYKVFLSNGDFILFDTTGTNPLNVTVPYIGLAEAGTLSVNITKITPYDINNIQKNMEDIDLENIKIGRSALVNITNPDWTIIGIQGPSEIYENTEFTVTYISKYKVYGGDLSFKDNYNNIIIIPNGEYSVTKTYIYDNDAYKNNNYLLAITGIVSKAGFSSVDKTGGTIGFPISISATILPNPDDITKIEITERNIKRDFFVFRQTGINSTPSGDIGGVNLKLSSNNIDINTISIINSKIIVNDFDTNEKIGEISYTIDNNTNIGNNNIPTDKYIKLNFDDFYYKPNTTEYDNYKARKIKITLPEQSILDEDFKIFEKIQGTTNALIFTLHRWRQTLVELVGNITDYVEGEPNGSFTVITSLAPKYGDLKVVLNDTNSTVVIIPKNTTSVSIDIPIHPDTPYIDYQNINLKGITSVDYYNKDNTVDWDKEYHECYISKNGLNINIADKVSNAIFTYSYPSSIEGSSTINIPFNFDIKPDPLMVKPLNFDLILKNKTTGALIRKYPYSSGTTPQDSIFSIPIQDFSNTTNVTFTVTNISGGNFENITIMGNGDSVIVPRPNKDAKLFIDLVLAPGEKLYETGTFKLQVSVEDANGAGLAPKNYDLELLAEVKFLGSSNTYPISFIIPKGKNVSDIKSFDIEILGNDIYKSTAPETVIYLFPTTELASKYDFDTMSIMITKDNPIIIKPEDYIPNSDIVNFSITNLKFSTKKYRYNNIDYDSILQKENIIGSEISFDTNLSSGYIFDAARTFNFNLKNNNIDVATKYAITGNNTKNVSKTNTFTTTEVGLFKPNLGSTWDLFEKVQEDPVNIVTLNTYPKPVIRVGFGIDKNFIQEDIGTSVETFDITADMLTITKNNIPITLDSYNYNLHELFGTSVIDIPFTITSSRLTSPLTDKISLKVSDDGKTLNTIKKISLDKSIFDDFLTEDGTKSVTINIASSSSTQSNCTVEVNAFSKQIKFTDEQDPTMLDTTLLSVSASKNMKKDMETGQYILTEPGGLFEIQVSISNPVPQDMPLSIGLYDINNTLLNTLSVTILKDQKDSIINADFRVPDDVYKIPDNFIFARPLMTNFNKLSFEKVAINPAANEIKILLINNTTEIKFEVIYSKSEELTINKFDQAGLGNTISALPHYGLIVQGFYDDSTGTKNYYTFENDDEISLNVVEKSGSSPTRLIFSRGRTLKLSSKYLKITNNLSAAEKAKYLAIPGFDVNTKMFYDLPLNLYDYFGSSLTTGTNTITFVTSTQTDELIKRFNRIPFVTDTYGATGYTNYLSADSNNYPFNNVSNSAGTNGIWVDPTPTHNPKQWVGSNAVLSLFNVVSTANDTNIQGTHTLTNGTGTIKIPFEKLTFVKPKVMPSIKFISIEELKYTWNINI